VDPASKKPTCSTVACVWSRGAKKRKPVFTGGRGIPRVDQERASVTARGGLDYVVRLSWLGAAANGRARRGGKKAGWIARAPEGSWFGALDGLWCRIIILHLGCRIARACVYIYIVQKYFWSDYFRMLEFGINDKILVLLR
jgi:hypothetical protein